jgi:hypothetical protein
MEFPTDEWSVATKDDKKFYCRYPNFLLHI